MHKKKKLKQIIVRKVLRKKEMEVTHDTMLAGHMGVKKTKIGYLLIFIVRGFIST